MRTATKVTAAAVFLGPGIAIAEPNVLLIIADDMGLDASHCYDLGDQQAPMPNVEAMCAEGLVFDNAYAAPVCSPTRATIMTGQYGLRTGVGAPVAPVGTNGLDADTLSLFDVLANTDYSANLIGKWHLAGAGSDLNHPAELGVPDYFGLFRGTTRDYSNWTAVENGQEVQVDTYTTTAFTDRSIDWIGAQDEPWFLWLAHNAPHSPFHLPPADLHSFNDLVDDEDVIAENPLPYYQAMLEALDTEIGRLMGSMSEEDRDNTVVIFIGDNGSPNQVTPGFYGIHDAKGTIYEGGTHIPMVAWGAGISPGRSDAFVNTTDIFATIAEIAGASTDVSDSISFKPVLEGGEGDRDYIHVELFLEDDTSSSDIYGWAVRQDQMKLVSLQNGTEALYDLSVDATEQSDLLADGISDDEQEAVDSLRQIRADLEAQ